MPHKTFADGVAPEVLARLIGIGEVSEYRRNQILFLQGDPGGTVALIHEGWVKVVSASRSGVELILALRGPRDIVGELAVFDDGPRSATVRALGPVRVTLIPALPLRRLVSETPQLSLAMIENVTRRQRESDRKRLEQASTTTLQRVAAQILELADADGRTHPDARIEVPMRLTRAELASAASVSPRMLMRALGRLRERGIVESAERRRLIIAEPSVLRLLTDAALDGVM